MEVPGRSVHAALFTVYGNAILIRSTYILLGISISIFIRFSRYQAFSSEQQTVCPWLNNEGLNLSLGDDHRFTYSSLKEHVFLPQSTRRQPSLSLPGRPFQVSTSEVAHTVKNGSLLYVSKIVSILLSKLSDCPNTDTSLCYCNYPFLTVQTSSKFGNDINTDSVVLGLLWAVILYIDIGKGLNSQGACKAAYMIMSYNYN